MALTNRAKEHYEQVLSALTFYCYDWPEKPTSLTIKEIRKWIKNRYGDTLQRKTINWALDMIANAGGLIYKGNDTYELTDSFVDIDHSNFA